MLRVGDEDSFRAGCDAVLLWRQTVSMDVGRSNLGFHVRTEPCRVPSVNLTVMSLPE